ncbi:MAG: insulinase family protein [Bacteroidetes bacterium]|nr:insulinase family protein [Bacteroidota bacterium]
MIKYNKFTLNNGLRVIVYPDRDSNVVGINIMYDVGSRDEISNKTGFAHLFEHLMFGGSKNISNYDSILQKVGGINNAYTSFDVTNYYCLLPKGNIETALWLESDRMLELSFNPKVLDIQKKVVTEEYKEGLNRPYGDYWRNLCSMMYKKHPYRWPTIGLHISHVNDATMDDVKSFFNKFYKPNNAVLVISGGITEDKIEGLVDKWFGDIKQGNEYIRKLPKEPILDKPRKMHFKRNIPSNAIYKAYHIPGRFEDNYYSVDLLCNILGAGKSSRLYENLVNKKRYFNRINSYVTGSVDTGLLIIAGFLNDKVTFEDVDSAINEIIDELKSHEISNSELEKVKNQSEAFINFSEMDMLNASQELAMGELNGNINFINEEIDKIRKVNIKDIKLAVNKFLNFNVCGTLYYEKN